MNITILRKYRRRGRTLRALLARNPVLVLGLDLPFVIVCATTLKTAVALSAEMLFIHMVTMTVALLTLRLPVWARPLVNVGVSFLAMMTVRFVIIGLFPELLNYAGMYVYLMAVNGITMYQSSRLGNRRRHARKPGGTLVVAFLYALAFALVMLVVSLFREYFSSGMLWGIPVPSPFFISGLALPFSGFLFTGFLLAISRRASKRLLGFLLVETARREAHYTEIERRRVPLVLEQIPEPERPSEEELAETAESPPLED